MRQVVSLRASSEVSEARKKHITPRRNMMNDSRVIEMINENDGNHSRPIYELSTNELQQVAGGDCSRRYVYPASSGTTLSEVRLYGAGDPVGNYNFKVEIEAYRQRNYCLSDDELDILAI